MSAVPVLKLPCAIPAVIPGRAVAGGALGRFPTVLQTQHLPPGVHGAEGAHVPAQRA